MAHGGIVNNESVFTQNVLFYKSPSVARQFSIPESCELLDVPIGVEEDLSINGRDRSSKVKVQVTFHFHTVGDIDTVAQHFECESFIQVKWREPALKDVKPGGLPHINWCDYWDPHLKLVNVEGSLLKCEQWRRVRFEDGAPYVLLRWHFKGTFIERLELKHFPCDVQDLSLTLSTDRSVDEVDLVADEDDISTVNPYSFQDQQEWWIYQHVQVMQGRPDVHPLASKGHPELTGTCRVARKPAYYIWNVWMIMFLLICLSFCGFAIEPDLIPKRMQNSLTLLLTAVAFKFVVSKNLPTISYLTYLDMYVLVGMLYLGMMIVIFAFLSAFNRDMEIPNKLDTIVLIILVVFQVLFHIAYVAFYYVKAYGVRRSMDHKDIEYLKEKASKEKKQGSDEKKMSREYSFKSSQSQSPQTQSPVRSPLEGAKPQLGGNTGVVFVESPEKRSQSAQSDV